MRRTSIAVRMCCTAALLVPGTRCVLAGEPSPGRVTISWPGPAAPPAAGEAGACLARTQDLVGARFRVVPDDGRVVLGDVLRVTAETAATLRLNGRVTAALRPGEAWVVTPGWKPLDLDASAPVRVTVVRAVPRATPCPDVALFEPPAD